MQTWHIFMLLLMWVLLVIIIGGIWNTLKEINKQLFEKALREHEQALFKQVEEIRNDFS